MTCRPLVVPCHTAHLLLCRWDLQPAASSVDRVCCVGQAGVADLRAAAAVAIVPRSCCIGGAAAARSDPRIVCNRHAAVAVCSLVAAAGMRDARGLADVHGAAAAVLRLPEGGLLLLLLLGWLACRRLLLQRRRLRLGGRWRHCSSSRALLPGAAAGGCCIATGRRHRWQQTPGV